MTVKARDLSQVVPQLPVGGRDEEDVVGARLELLLHQLDALHGLWPQPAALVQNPESIRLWNEALVSDANMVALALSFRHGRRTFRAKHSWGWWV